MSGVCRRGADNPLAPPGQDGGQASWIFGAHGIHRVWQFLFEDMAVQEKDSQSLVLGGGGYVLMRRQVGQEGFYLRHAHLLGMEFIMEEDVAPDPVHVGLFGADGIVLELDGIAHLIQEFLGALFRTWHPFLWFAPIVLYNLLVYNWLDRIIPVLAPSIKGLDGRNVRPRHQDDSIRRNRLHLSRWEVV